jgi:DNA-binding response OmpR family regulator
VAQWQKPKRMRKRALIFDDEELLRFLYREVCERHGYEVLEFSSPVFCPLHAKSQCVCAPGEACTDVIISDLDMPKVRGLDFVEAQIRKGCHCQHILLVSGSCDESTYAQARKLGCKVIEKPFRLQQIEAWLDEVDRSLSPTRVLHDLDAPAAVTKPSPAEEAIAPLAGSPAPLPGAHHKQPGVGRH